MFGKQHFEGVTVLDERRLTRGTQDDRAAEIEKLKAEIKAKDAENMRLKATLSVFIL